MVSNSLMEIDYSPHVPSGTLHEEPSPDLTSFKPGPKNLTCS